MLLAVTVVEPPSGTEVGAALSVPLAPYFFSLFE